MKAKEFLDSLGYEREGQMFHYFKLLTILQEFGKQQWNAAIEEAEATYQLAKSRSYNPNGEPDISEEILKLKR